MQCLLTATTQEGHHAEVHHRADPARQGHEEAWAYGAIYATSTKRTAALAGRIDFYNRRRPHGALSHKPSIARLTELNNLLGSYS